MEKPDDSVLLEIRGRVAIVTLNRVEKRNAFSKRVFDGLDRAFDNLTDEVRAVVVAANGKHFCAGLDLAEHKHAAPFDALFKSRDGHRRFNKIRDCGRPVISAMHGAVIGGGMELVCSTHIRVADTTTFYELPEGRRGIFVGGGASVSVAKVIGTDRLIEMMLTGRRLDADTGDRLGLSHYLVEPGTALEKAIEIAENVAGNAPISNYMMLHALMHIDDMPQAPGYFTESLAQALTMTSEDATHGIDAFLEKRKISF
jgi:(methylthio)acryloyl-CoA hydratase